MAYNPLSFSKSINDELSHALVTTLNSGFWSTGPESLLLQRNFNQLYNRYCIATSSGGSALQLLSEVYPSIKKIAVQSNTYFATCLPWLNKGCEIVLMGSSGTLLMPDIDVVKAAIETSPDAIVITHIGGYPHPHISEIAALCLKNGILLFEDCAHAPLAYIDNKIVGTFGNAAVLSFYPTKPIPAGEGGLLILESEALSTSASKIRDYGKSINNEVVTHRLPALPNARMNEFTASVVNVILKNYHTIISHKNRLAAIYDDVLGPLSYFTSNYSSQSVRPSYYKYICFLDSHKLSTSQVYDRSNQIYSILSENLVPFGFVGDEYYTLPHTCLPITPSMSLSDARSIVLN